MKLQYADVKVSTISWNNRDGDNKGIRTIQSRLWFSHYFHCHHYSSEVFIKIKMFSCVKMLLVNFDQMKFRGIFLLFFQIKKKKVSTFASLNELVRTCLSRHNGAPLCHCLSFALLFLSTYQTCLFPSTTCKKSQDLVMDTVYRPWGHLFPLIKGECKYVSGQILISVQWEVPSCLWSEPELYVCVCVCVCVYLCVIPRAIGNDNADSSHLLHLSSPESAFSSFK